MIALTILAWATQTLRHQWGFGAEIDYTPNAGQFAPTPADSSADSSTEQSAIQPIPSNAPPTTAPVDDGGDAVSGKETFVPGEARFGPGATLEMRSEATIVGTAIKLKQICRWSDADKPVFNPVADFVVEHINSGSPFKTIRISDLKTTLQDAGINLATINVVGASACTVSRSDTAYDEQTALQQWIDSKQGNAGGAATQPAVDAQSGDAQAGAQQNGWSDTSAQGVTVSATPVSAPLAATAVTAAATEQKQYHTLRELLTQDVATRTSLSPDQLEMNFRAEDERVLSLSEPAFRFQIDPEHVRDLGNVSWSVTILAAGESHRVTINAEARAWQQQLVLTRPVDSRQVIQPGDYVQRRTLVDSLPSEPLLTADQLSNEQASESLKPGTVMTARMVDALPLVKAGQFVTVTIAQGAVQIKSVATAMESGSYGQTIRVRNESTRDIFEVTMTGPQEATMLSGSASESSSLPVAAAR